MNRSIPRIDPILKRRLASLQYSDPETLLHEVLPKIQARFQKAHVTRVHSHNEQKTYIEKYQAAFLAFMVKHSMRTIAEVSVCVHESDDFDCVLKAIIQGGDTIYKPVQLKQLPSHELNEKAQIQTEIDKLQRLGSSPRLVVAFWINRDMKLDLGQLSFDGLTIEQLWFFGDSPAGYPTLHGGLIGDLCSGTCLAGHMRNGNVIIKRKHFKPKASSGG